MADITEKHWDINCRLSPCVWPLRENIPPSGVDLCQLVANCKIQSSSFLEAGNLTNKSYISIPATGMPPPFAFRLAPHALSLSLFLHVFNNFFFMVTIKCFLPHKHPWFVLCNGGGFLPCSGIKHAAGHPPPATAWKFPLCNSLAFPTASHDKQLLDLQRLPPHLILSAPGETSCYCAIVPCPGGNEVLLRNCAIP